MTTPRRLLRRRYEPTALQLSVFRRRPLLLQLLLKRMRMLIVASPTAAHALRPLRGSAYCRSAGVWGPPVRPGVGPSRSVDACPVQCVVDVRPSSTARFRIQFYAVCAARPIIEFQREQLVVGSATAAAAAASSSCTVMNPNNAELTTSRSHSSVRRSSR